MLDAAAPEETMQFIELAGFEFQDGDVLLLVDVLNDFFEGGALAVSGAEEIVPVLNRWIVTFRVGGAPIVSMGEWHPEQTRHFEEYGGPWKPHGLAGTWGAMPHPDLMVPEMDNPSIVELTSSGKFAYGIKGFNPNDDGYSAFDGKIYVEGMGEVTLLEYIGLVNGQRLFVAGLATDFCIKNTVLDALAAEIPTFLILDAIAAVNQQEGDEDAALEEMRRAGAVFILPEEDESDPDVGKYVQVTEGVNGDDPAVNSEDADEAEQDEILAEGEEVDTGDVVSQADAEGSEGEEEDDEEAVDAVKAKPKRARKKKVAAAAEVAS